MERLLEDWQHEYRATPWEYPITDNNSPATYDQFIKLRDTLVYSNKIYAENAGRSLIIGTKLDGTPTDTIEIREPNIMEMTFEPSWTTDTWNSTWEYVTTWWHTSQNPISCEIVKTGRYRLQHKEQFNNIDSSITRIHWYIIQHKTDWTTVSRAVFDWEWDTPWELKRVTSFGYRECNLSKWDWLELVVEDQNGNSIISQAASSSNWWMVEYIDLAY